MIPAGASAVIVQGDFAPNGTGGPNGFGDGVDVGPADDASYSQHLVPLSTGISVSGTAAVALTAGRQLKFTATGAGGSADLSIVGYTSDPQCFKPVATAPLLDTSSGTGVAPGAMEAGQTAGFVAAGAGGLPANAQAYLFSVTAKAPLRATTTVTLTDPGETQPAGTLVAYANTAATSLVVVPALSTGALQVSSDSGVASLSVQPIGWFATPASFVPHRLVALDTALHIGTASSTLSFSAPITAPVPTLAGASHLTLAISFTPNSATGLRIRGAASPSPTQPTVLGAPFRTTTQLVALGPDSGNRITVSIARGTATVRVEVVGWSADAPAVNQPPTTTLIPAANQIAGATIAPDLTTAVVDYTGPGTVQHGDVVALGASDAVPTGYLGVVTNVSPVSAARRATGVVGQNISLRSVTLTDAIPNADINATAPVQSDDPQALADPGPLPPADPPPPPGQGAMASSPSPAVPTTRPAANTGGSLPNKAPFTCSAGVKVDISAALKLSASINLTAILRFLKTPIVSFQFNGNLSGTVRADAQAKAECHTKDINLDGPTLPTITFLVGPVPVVIVPKLTMAVDLNGSIEGAVSASATVTNGVSAGITYNNGFSSNFHASGPSVSGGVQARANAQAHVAVTPRLTMFVYGAVGPYAEIGAFSDAKVDLFATPWWKITGGVRAAAGLTLNLWFWQHSYEAVSGDLLHYMIAQATTPYGGPQVDTNALNAGRGQHYSTTLGASGGRAPYNWYRVSGGLPPGIGLSQSGTLSGTPTTNGHYSFVVRVIDANGNRSADQAISFDVGDGGGGTGGGGGGGCGSSCGGGGGGPVSISKGASAVGQPNCTHSSCAFVTVNFSGFAPGPHQVSCFSTLDSGAFYTYTTSNTTTSYCYYGYPGRSVWVTVDGTQSNVIVW